MRSKSDTSTTDAEGESRGRAGRKPEEPLEYERGY